jgi:hypothetical protein|tara:strand:+ start:614 stop:1207 length:594 start_codon:yes stop_codon:yes gene_type:complete
MEKEFQNIYDEIVGLMQDAISESSHAYRTFSLASVDDKSPKVRTVVLRDFNKKNNYFEFHSDIRSPKLTELKNNNNFSALFYSSQNKVQIRFSGKAEVFYNCSETVKRWEQVTPSSKRCYMGPFSPSESLSKYHPNIPESVKFKNPSDKESSAGYKNFVIVRCHFNQVDYLKLKYSGHFRCNFVLSKAKINAEWIAP